MATLSVVEHLNILEQIGFGLVPAAIANPVHALSLKGGEEAFHDGIVIAVAGAAHGAFDVVIFECLAEIVT